MGIAESSFAVPAVEMLEPGQCRVEILVLAPTRELAQQVASACRPLQTQHGLRSVAVYGGKDNKEHT